MKALQLLLIEDDPDSAEAIRLLLGTEGITTEWAGSAEEALAHFQADPPRRFDVILLDLRLPDLDGETLIARMAELAPLPAIIVHSAAPQAETQAAARRMGALAVLRKPTDWGKLRHLLESVDAAETGRY